VTNPVNGVELAKVPKMSTAETTQAVEAAERAFPAWPNSPRNSAPIPYANGSISSSPSRDLALILTSEQGKPLAEALGEVDIAALCQSSFPRKRAAFMRNYPTQKPDARLLAIKQRSASAARSRRGIFPVDDHSARCLPRWQPVAPWS